MSSQSIISTLATGDVANLGPAAGQLLRINKGYAWVTQGDERDIIVESGDSLVLDGPGDALVTALEGAVAYEVHEAHEQPLAA